MKASAPLNRQFKLAARPVGLLKRSDFEEVQGPVPQPAEGEVLLKVLMLSLDPAMRGWVNKGKSYIPPVNIGEVMRAGGACTVVASKDPAFKPGDVVTGMVGVQEYAVLPGKALTRVDPGVPLAMQLSVLGATGMTAYFGLLDVGQPKPGETVVVSGAAGAVGSIVGQIAKIKGCRAVGIAGGPEKCRWLVEHLGFDAAIDYKKHEVLMGLREYCPKGVDVYFDNVGGEILDIVLTQLAMKARVVICGAISQYNATAPPQGPKNYMSLLVNRARMEGMVVFDYQARYGEAIRQLAQWARDGKLKYEVHVVEGLETFPETLNKLFAGENTGKLLLKVADA